MASHIVEIWLMLALKDGSAGDASTLALDIWLPPVAICLVALVLMAANMPAADEKLHSQ